MISSKGKYLWQMRRGGGGGSRWSKCALYRAFSPCSRENNTVTAFYFQSKSENAIPCRVWGDGLRTGIFIVLRICLCCSSLPFWCFSTSIWCFSNWISPSSLLSAIGQMSNLIRQIPTQLIPHSILFLVVFIEFLCFFDGSWLYVYEGLDDCDSDHLSFRCFLRHCLLSVHVLFVLFHPNLWNFCLFTNFWFGLLAPLVVNQIKIRVPFKIWQWYSLMESSGSGKVGEMFDGARIS